MKNKRQDSDAIKGQPYFEEGEEGETSRMNANQGFNNKINDIGDIDLNHHRNEIRGQFGFLEPTLPVVNKKRLDVVKRLVTNPQDNRRVINATYDRITTLHEPNDGDRSQINNHLNLDELSDYKKQSRLHHAKHYPENDQYNNHPNDLDIQKDHYQGYQHRSKHKSIGISSNSDSALKIDQNFDKINQQQRIPSKSTFGQQQTIIASNNHVNQHINNNGLNELQHQGHPASDATTTNNFLLATCILLIAIIGLLLTHKWISRWLGKKIVKFKIYKRNLRCKFSSNANPNNQPSELNENNNKFDSPNSKATIELGTINNNNNNNDNNIGMYDLNDNSCLESIQLVNRTPKRFQKLGGDAVYVDQSISRCNEKYNKDSPEWDANKSFRKTKTHQSVISMKKRSTRSSFITAVKRTSPKISLLSAKVRRFIDDEAQDLKEKCENNSDEVSWTDRILAKLMIPLAHKSSSNISHKSNNDVRINLGDNYEPDEAATQALLRDLDASDKENEEHHSTLGQSNKQSQLDNGCGSISGISISHRSSCNPSPPDQPLNRMTDLQSTASCAFLEHSTNNFANKRDVGDDTTIEQRSKSQGHSPNMSTRPCCNQAPDNNPFLVFGGSLATPMDVVSTKDQLLINTNTCNANQILTRPCYSASPSNMPINHTPIYQSASSCAYQIECHHQDHKHVCEHQPNFDSIQPSVINSQNFHLKRQYENYYDDEHSDPYHNLTTSIGMELADMALSHTNPRHHSRMHHHHHHQHSYHHNPYDPKETTATNGFVHAISDLNQYQHAPKSTFQAPPALTMTRCMMAHANTTLHQDQIGNGISIGKSCCQSVSPIPIDYLQKNHLLSCHQHLDASSFSRCATKGSSNADQSGSAGDILLSSSTSTSLGGSDNCFMQYNNNNPTNCSLPVTGRSSCSNSRIGQLMCACQQVGCDAKDQYFTPHVQLEPAPLVRPKSPGNSGPRQQQRIQSPPMTILVQQPSLTSRSPSPSRLFEANNEDKDQHDDQELTNTIKLAKELPEGDNNVITTSDVRDSRDINDKRDPRSLNNKHGQPSLSAVNHHLARRTSIAGDRISRAHCSMDANDANHSRICRNNHAKRSIPSNQNDHRALIHRASIASSDPQSGNHEIQMQIHHQIHHQHVMQSVQDFIPSQLEPNFVDQNNNNNNNNNNINYDHNTKQAYLQQQQSHIGIAEMSPVQQPMMMIDPCQYQYNQLVPMTVQQHNYCMATNFGNHNNTQCEPTQRVQNPVFDQAGPMGANYPMYHPVYHPKSSACSSSAGSTSGLGISGTGSACTNTPTGTLHSFISNYQGPFSWAQTEPNSVSTPPSSASITTASGQFQSLSSYLAPINGPKPSANQHDLSISRLIDQTGASPLSRINVGISPSLIAQHQVPRRSINPANLHPHIKSMQNRKLSLPTHLESQSSRIDYLAKAYQITANNATGDNQQSNQQSTCSKQHRNRAPFESRQSTIQMISDSDVMTSQAGNEARRLSCQRDESSRRSSQTITRQSSFWLEDNSLDSIMSSVDVAKNLDLDDEIEVEINEESKDGPLDPTSAEINNNYGKQQQEEAHPSGATGDNDGDENKENGDEFDDRGDDGNNENDDEDDDEGKHRKHHKRDARKEKLSFNGKNHSRCSPRLAAGGRIRLARGGVFAKFSSSSSSSNAGVSPSPSPDFSSKSRETIKSRTMKATSTRANNKRYPFVQRANKNNNRANPPRETQPNSASDPTACLVPESSSNDGTPINPEPNLEIQVGHQPKGVTPGDEGTTRSSPVLLVTRTSDNKQIDETGSRSTNNSCENDNASLDTDFSNGQPPVARPVGEQNSGSFERQCRELWKLRATLQDDSCDADDWSNYHQRLNKRYDSGYKSLEQQLSSSLEGSILLMQDNNNNSGLNQGSANNTSGLAMAPPSSAANSQTDEPERPKSGCSRLIDYCSPTEQTKLKKKNRQTEKYHIDTHSLVDERELKLITTSQQEVGLLSNVTDERESPGAELDPFKSNSGRESKCSILSESSQLAKMVGLDVDMDLEDQQPLVGMNIASEGRIDEQRENKDFTSRNSSRSSNEENDINRGDAN